MTETLSDMHVEAARIQQEIKDYLGLRTSDLVFEYSNVEGKVKLDLITINPRHNQAFLFHSEHGADKVAALRKMRNYVQKYKEKENSIPFNGWPRAIRNCIRLISRPATS
jgi:protein tyrosine/serine phosphatase